MKKSSMLQSFAIGAAGYPLLEILYRGRTHWSMSAAGGLSMLGIVQISESCRKKTLAFRAAKCALYITGIELFAGLIVNRLLRKRVWDYSERCGNCLGQTCPAFSLRWFLLSLMLCGLLEKRRK